MERSSKKTLNFQNHTKSRSVSFQKRRPTLNNNKNILDRKQVSIVYDTFEKTSKMTARDSKTDSYLVKVGETFNN
jgi:hypothetical protein